MHKKGSGEQEVDYIEKVVYSFVGSPGNLHIYPIGHGHINSTFQVTCDNLSFILQKINDKVFSSPEIVAVNSAKISAHVHGTAENEPFPVIMTTLKGEFFHRCEKGGIWRAQTLIENGKIMSFLSSTNQAFQAGSCLGKFHRLMDTLAVDTLDTAIPHFHDLPKYLESFDAAFDTYKKTEPDTLFVSCLETISRFRNLSHFFDGAVMRGDLALRVIHGDPKVTNIIFESTSDQAITLIDLDTVGPGLLLHDIGDCLRSCCLAGEESDLHGAGVGNVEFIEAVLRGYHREMMLTPFEVDSIYESLLLISFELGVRFLTDYLQGNCYFTVSHDDENLHRAGVQFRLVEWVNNNERKIRDLAKEIFEQYV